VVLLGEGEVSWSTADNVQLSGATDMERREYARGSTRVDGKEMKRVDEGSREE
jgi:hypothetical protein